MYSLGTIERGAGNELQLTDAIAREITDGDGVYGYRFRGQRFDCGSKAGFLQATVAFGLARDDLSVEFSQYLEEMMAVRKAAQ
jgi:UTP--glucose-1-phosphate uridylyltransferase